MKLLSEDVASEDVAVHPGPGRPSPMAVLATRPEAGSRAPDPSIRRSIHRGRVDTFLDTRQKFELARASLDDASPQDPLWSTRACVVEGHH